MKFAISSCWNSHRHEDGYALLRELADLGFEWVELSHGIRLSLIPGILKGVEDGLVRISSLHNFCPLPVGVMGAAPNLYEPSAPGRQERALWLSNTRRTVDFANRVDCDRVVLHSGRVRFRWRDPQHRLEVARKAAGPEGGEVLERARDKGLQQLRKAQGAFIAHLRDSFSRIAEHAARQGVRFGVENREGFTELPLDEDMVRLLDSLDEGGVFGYWHDTGHACLKEQAGLLDHGVFLESLRPRLLGFHLHDVTPEGRDHQPPGRGLVDWPALAPLIRKQDVVVLEMSPRLEASDILEGRDFLLKTLPALSAT